MILAAIFALVAASTPAIPCAPVSGDRIRAGELARVSPVFATLDPALAITYAPTPGARRILNAGELRRLALRHGLAPGEITGVCLEFPAAGLDADRVLAAIRAAVNQAEARIELSDFSRHRVPEGKLEFPRAAASVAADGTILWRGKLRYAEGRSVPVWARARIVIVKDRVVAAEKLPAGQLIRSDQLRTERADVSLMALPAIESAEEAAGRKPRRTIEAGQPLHRALLAAAREIEPGDRVAVEVSSGAARLKLDAVAETGGSAGDRIVLRNPAGGRFAARVEGRGRAIVIAVGKGKP